MKKQAPHDGNSGILCGPPFCLPEGVDATQTGLSKASAKGATIKSKPNGSRMVFAPFQRCEYYVQKVKKKKKTCRRLENKKQSFLALPHPQPSPLRPEETVWNRL